jgi:uncharacterized protein YdhG (YjbR/CyaY superfamily)
MVTKHTIAVEDYIASFPKDIQEVLIKMRKTILEKAPEAVEFISYGMPCYKTNGKPLVYFAGYQNHIGFYATPTGHLKFSEELSKYKTGKGSVQFPINQPLPIDLIERIVEFRVNENKSKSKK